MRIYTNIFALFISGIYPGSGEKMVRTWHKDGVEEGEVFITWFM